MLGPWDPQDAGLLFTKRICFKCGARGCGFGRRFEGSRLAKVFFGSAFHVLVLFLHHDSLFFAPGKFILEESLLQTQSKKLSSSHKFVNSEAIEEVKLPMLFSR